MIDTNDSSERQVIKNQRMSSSEALVGILSNLVDERDVHSIIESQKNMLEKNNFSIYWNLIEWFTIEGSPDLKRLTKC